MQRSAFRLRSRPKVNQKVSCQAEWQRKNEPEQPVQRAAVVNRVRAHSSNKSPGVGRLFETEGCCDRPSRNTKSCQPVLVHEGIAVLKEFGPENQIQPIRI